MDFVSPLTAICLAISQPSPTVSTTSRIGGAVDHAATQRAEALRHHSARPIGILGHNDVGCVVSQPVTAFGGRPQRDDHLHVDVDARAEQGNAVIGIRSEEFVSSAELAFVDDVAIEHCQLADGEMVVVGQRAAPAYAINS